MRPLPSKPPSLSSSCLWWWTLGSAARVGSFLHWVTGIRQSIHPGQGTMSRHLTGSRACFKSGLWNLPSAACWQAPSQQYTLCFLRGWGDCGWKKNTSDNNKEGERGWKIGAGSQGDKNRNSGRNRPLTRSGLLETLSKVSICEARRRDLYLRGGRRSGEKGYPGYQQYVSGG